MNFSKHRQDQHAGFQMAPMVDIMFLLLIFFMAAVIYATWENKMSFRLPTADRDTTGQPKVVGEIVINLDENGRIFINSFEQSPEQLESLLGKIRETTGTPGKPSSQPVIIRAHADTRHKDVVRVMNICRRVDVFNLSFAYLPEAAEGSAN